MKQTTEDRSSSGNGDVETTTLTLHSSAFDSKESIPRVYTCEGDDLSPPLNWSGLPEEAQSLALIVDDPDAPGRTFTHWLLFNVPPDRTALPRNLDVDTHFSGTDPMPKEGKNDFGNVGYGGPCPPEGDAPHRYVFRLCALDSVLDLKRGANTKILQSAMDGHVLAEAELVGTFQR